MFVALQPLGTTIQIVLICLAVLTLMAMTLGIRTMTAALALLALSFVGMALRGEQAALVALSMGTLMELRLPLRDRHKGLLEWLLVALVLCQVAIAMSLEYRTLFWLAQGLATSVHCLALISAFYPGLWQPGAQPTFHRFWRPSDTR